MGVGTLNFFWNTGVTSEDISNLNTYHYKVCDDPQTFSKNYQFTTKLWETQRKLMEALRPL